MSIKKFFKYTLVTTFSLGLISLASFMSVIEVVSNPKQTSQTTSVIPIQANENIQNDSVDIRKVAINNWSWPNDVYAKTNGYTYHDVYRENTGGGDAILTINKDGFDIHAGVNYSNPSMLVFPPDYPGGMSVSFDHPSMNINLDITSQKFNSSTNNINEAASVALPMVFGKNSSFNNSSDEAKEKKLNLELPYLQLNIPIVQIELDRYQSNETNHAREKTYNALAQLRKINDRNNRYDGEIGASVQTVRTPTHDPVWASSYHYHSSLIAYKVTLKIFNDYDIDGNYLDTHMLNHGMNFHSLLPTLSIDENKLDKKNNALKQDLNINSILTLSNAQSLPSLGGATITAIKNAALGQISFNYKPNLVFNNGVLEKYTGSGITQVVKGFSILKTFIQAKPNIENPIVVDQFINSVKKDGIVDAVELGKYLDLSTVPEGSSYSILDDTIKTNLVTGIIEFQIDASNGLNFDGTLSNEKTPYFDVSLQLTPRITKISYTGFLDDILVTEYYNKVFDQSGLVNQNEFNKYSIMIAPVDNAQYYLIPDTYELHTGDGTVSFKLYASEFHDATASVKTGGIDITESHFEVNLKLNPLPSYVTVKKDYTPTHRVDKLVDLIVDADGKITPEGATIMENYIDLSNIPSDAEFSIDQLSIDYDEFNDDFFYEYVYFNLIVSKFNDDMISRLPTSEKIIPLKIKLLPVHKQTLITSKQDIIDNPERVDRLLPQIINKNGVVINRVLLEQYVDITALPKRSVLSIDNAILVESTGKLTFDLKASVAYDNDSNELLDEIYPIELQLGIKHIPTSFTPVANITDPERVDRFAQELKTLDSDGLKNYLFPKYIEVAGEFPIAEDQLEYKISELSYEDNGSLKFKLIVNSIYNKDSDPENNYGFPITLNLGQKFAPTNVSLYGTYPNGSTITQFKDMYTNYKDNQADLRIFLSRFLKGVDTIPDVADIDLNFLDDKTDVTTGKLVFKVQASAYYDANSDLVNPAVVPYISDEFELHLIPEDQIVALTTTIDWRADAPSPKKASDFYKTINPNNHVDFVALDNYFTLKNIPIEANITIVNHDPDFNNQLLLKFDIVLTQWWDTGTLKPQSGDADTTKTLSFEKLLFFVNTDSINVAFPWWWVALGISGLILILIVIFKYREIKRDIRFKHDALSSK